MKLPLAATLLCVCACHTEEMEPPQSGPAVTTSVDLLGLIHRETLPILQEVNPTMARTELVTMSQSLGENGTRYAALVIGYGKHIDWKTLANVGEIYAVIGLDSTLSRVTVRYGTFPRPRLGDYTVWFDAPARDDSLVVLGRGATYGDQEIRLAFAR